MGRAADLLIVDDDFTQVELTRLLLKDLGLPHRCHYVENGFQALDFLNRRPPFEYAPRPDLILLDVNMPGMNGCEVLQIIKTDSQFRLIPVIMLSNSGASKDLKACYSAHANAYIQKPVDLDSNMRLVRELDHFWFNIARLTDNPTADQTPGGK